MSQIQSMEHALYTGDYGSVVSVNVQGLDSEDQQRAWLLIRRAEIASGKASLAAENLDNSLVSKALAVYAEQTLGNGSDLAHGASEIAAEAVQKRDWAALHISALVLAGEDKIPEALAVLENHEQSLDCAMLQVYLYIALGDVEKASSVTENMRKWANDHVAFNLCEAWVALRENGSAAQKAYYIFEENNGFKQTARSHTGEAVAQLELLRLPEAAESIRRALELDDTAEDALATSAAIEAAQGKAPDSLARLQQLPKSHIVQDIKDKDALFDRVVKKYAVV